MKTPKPPFNTRLITVEDVIHPGVDRGWRIAVGWTARLVDAHATSIPSDVVTAVVVSKSLRLPCTFAILPSGKVGRFREDSYEI